MFLLLLGCSNEKNVYSNISEKKNYGILNYPLESEEVIDVTNLMINQSISSFIISSVFRFMVIKALKNVNSLSDLNKEKHLKAIYIAVNYLEVGKTSIWKDESKKIIGKVKVIRRFNLNENLCVSYKEIIKKSRKKNLDYVTACNIKDEWVIKNA